MSKIDGIKAVASRIGFGFQKHSPEILVVSGVVGLVGAAVLACKSTLKAQDILKETKSSLDDIATVVSDENISEEEYSHEDEIKDKIAVYTKTAGKLVKNYAPALVLGGLSIAAIFAGNDILRKRFAALAAAYATVDAGFREYRQRVVDRFGEDIDRELKYGIKCEKVTKTVKGEDGKRHRVTEKTDVVENFNEYSQYARFFDDSNPNWKPDNSFNLAFITTTERWANDKLKAQGYLFLNDVYEALGFDDSKPGQVVGWIYDPDNPNHTGDNYISFGIDPHKSVIRDFVNGRAEAIILDPNVDGLIWDRAFSIRR